VVDDVDVVVVSEVTVSVTVSVLVTVEPGATTVVGICTVAVTVFVFPGSRRILTIVCLMILVFTSAGSLTVVSGTRTMLPLTRTFVAGTLTTVLLLIVVTVPVTWIVRVAADAAPERSKRGAVPLRRRRLRRQG
jgi:hypothetical protein